MTTESALFHQRPNPVEGKAVPTPFGSMSYNVLREVIEQGAVLQEGQGAEIGIFEGVTSEYLLKSFPNLRLFCIDPFLDYSEHEPAQTQERMNACEKTARKRLSIFGERAQIRKDYSVSAANDFAEESLDFVFIDAVHSYEAVKEDLQAWYSKVRPGGLVSGHDFRWPGVQQALEEFLSEQREKAFYSPSVSDVWFFFKTA